MVAAEGREWTCGAEQGDAEEGVADRGGVRGDDLGGLDVQRARDGFRHPWRRRLVCLPACGLHSQTLLAEGLRFCTVVAYRMNNNINDIVKIICSFATRRHGICNGVQPWLQDTEHCALPRRVIKCTALNSY